MSASSLPPIVDIEWLRARGDEGVVLCDVRWTIGKGSDREAYRRGHAPGAVFVDLDVDLAAPAGPHTGRHPLPSPEAFASTLSRLGIDDKSVVIAYDGANGGFAARLVWMLRVLGRDAALLDGGLAAFGDDLEEGDVVRAPGRCSASPWPAAHLADVDEVAAAIDMPVAPFALVDARAPERYRGEVEPLDPVAGHIPGARNLPFTLITGPDGRFLDGEALGEKLRDLGLSKDAPVVVYCGSGVTACADILALWHRGFSDVRLYAGSWSEWCSDASRPMARGSRDDEERF